MKLPTKKCSKCLTISVAKVDAVDVDAITTIKEKAVDVATTIMAKKVNMATDVAAHTIKPCSE